MSYPVDDTNQSLDRKEPLDHPASPEVEIAFYLQNSQPGDRNLVDILVDSFARDIEWLIQVLLFSLHERTPSSAEVYDRVVETFVHAINHCDQFWGEASVRNWLYSLAIKLTHPPSRRGMIWLNLKRKSQDVTEQNEIIDQYSKIGDSSWKVIRGLPEKLYLALILHCVTGLSIGDIADILGVSAAKVHEWFINIRLKLLREEHEPVIQPELKSQKSDEHKINQALIHSRLDGLIEPNGKDAISLREHLSVCQTCNAYADVMEVLWGRLKSDLSDRFLRKGILENSLEQMKQSILGGLSESPRRNRSITPLRKVVWIALLLTFFATGTWALIRITPEQSEFPYTPTPTERFLPTPIVPGEASSMKDQSLEEPTLAAYALAPKISADGRWIAFTSNVELSGDESLNNWWDVMLYDTKARTLERISTQGMPMEGILLASMDISGDGRWIVFNAVADAIETNDEPCRSVTNLQCIDVFLYDRISARLTRITHAYDGSSANGYSMMPSISNNGRWILFWSIANNLVEDDKEVCEVDGRERSCIDLYVYDRISEGLERIGLGRGISGDSDFPGYYPAGDISDDGRWLLVTLQEMDRIVDQVGLQEGSDVYIYDREMQVFEPIDVATDGSEGNGISSYAQMTPDGRYISFYSTSDNLVVGDENGFGDIFLLDREDGEIKLISSAPDGTQANGDSGIDFGAGGEIAISNDASYIVYSSLATNLDPDSAGYCNPSDDNPCISIYVHNTAVNDTNRLEIPLENHFPLMPDISGDGSLISYIDIENSCSNTGNTCIDLKLYDREREWTSEITRNLFPRSDFPWVSDKVLQAPPYVTDLEFSPDGESIALAGNSPMVEIFSISDGRQVQSLEGNNQSSAVTRLVAYSPDGEYIAGGETDGTVNLWRTSDGSLAYLLDDHPGRILDLQFSVAGDFLYVTTPRSVWGWHISDQKFTREFTIDYPDRFVRDVDISPSKELLAVAPTKEPYVWIQRLPGGDVIHRLGGYGRNVSSVAFSPDGEHLIAQYQDGLTQIWLLEVDALGAIVPKLRKEEVLAEPLGRVVFSRDGKYAAVGSTYGGLWIWDLPNDRKQFVSGSFESSAISDIDFSGSGGMLVAASGDGVYLWNNQFVGKELTYFTQLTTDEFIQIPNRRRPLKNAQTDLGLDGFAAKGLTYYQAEDVTDLDVYAPRKLPANITYVSTSVRGDGGVITDYRVDDPLSGEPMADLYFFQQTISGNFRPFWVGASGYIESVEFNGRSAEYVKGDWVSLFSQKPAEESSQASQDLYWAWSFESGVQQLRWRNLDQLFSLVYIPHQNLDQSDQSASSVLDDGKLHQPLITKYDLIGIASGISSLPPSSGSSQMLINYSVSSGDTCTSIANRYDTSVNELIRLNNLSDNCDVILVGQMLQVPLPSDRVLFNESDLDCDGRIERIQAIPVPGFQASNITYGFVLDGLSDIGLYDTVWRYTIADLGMEYMINPQLLPVNGCQQLLAVNLLPIRTGIESGLNVFGWDGESMNLVFTADGWLQSVATAEEGVESLTTLKLEYLPGTSECNRIDVTYGWDGEKFNETSRSIEENGSCTLIR